MKSKSGEEMTAAYTTSFGVTVAIPRSEQIFYQLLHFLKTDGLIDEFGYRTYELYMFTYGYKIVA